MSNQEHRLAIIVPYRNRLEHLGQFIPYMNAYLSERQINNTIYVIEQEDGKPFNRAMLLNIGFLEAGSEHDYFVFHDIDMLPSDVDYTYRENPNHLAAAASQFGGRMPYAWYFGGVTMFSRNSFVAANGFSNEYWGAEDDDMYYRCLAAKLTIERANSGTFRSMDHKRAIDSNLRSSNHARCAKMERGELDWKADGINSCKYEVVERTIATGFILIKVSV